MASAYASERADRTIKEWSAWWHAQRDLGRYTDDVANQDALRQLLERAIDDVVERGKALAKGA